MNGAKTKIMSNCNDVTDVALDNNSRIKVVNEYVYLGQRISFDKNSQRVEISRRIQLGWTAFGKLCDVFNSKFPQYLKTQVFDQCVLPTLTYASETWSLNEDHGVFKDCSKKNAGNTITAPKNKQMEQTKDKGDRHGRMGSKAKMEMGWPSNEGR